VGKWHLGQRTKYLPGNHGFDYYLGIPYSVDMGTLARETPCNGGESRYVSIDRRSPSYYDDPRQDTGVPLPLVQQIHNVTTIVEQPLDLTTLNPKYAKFAVDFIKQNKDTPFFLYIPFSHVHTANTGIVPYEQYASCNFINSTNRGRFGDALAEVDWMAGQVVDELVNQGVDKNTFVILTSDNGPWLEKTFGAGSVGIFTGRASGYWNTGKGSTWEGGIREPAFVYWPGQIKPATRSDETVSSLDVLPTILNLAGIPLPTDLIIDGKNFWPIIQGSKSAWRNDYLFHYSGNQVHAVTHGPYKAHFITAPGLGGCDGCKTITWNPPLFFNIQTDPSEAYPLTGAQYNGIIANITSARKSWESTFVWGQIEQGAGAEYAICCDTTKKCICD